MAELYDSSDEMDAPWACRACATDNSWGGNTCRICGLSRNLRDGEPTLPVATATPAPPDESEHW